MSGPPVLTVTDLAKTYPTGDRALRGVSLTLDGRDAVFVIGSSGAGKSTLLRCLNRLVEPDRGSVKLDGEEVTTLRGRPLREARRRMAMIFQEFNLVERLTVMENVLSGRLGYVSLWRAWRRRFPPADVEAAYRTLARVGLAGFENKRADALSGGQRQRVGIARALVQRPRILLVDEPTSSLDPRTSEAVLRLIVDLAGEDGIPALVNIHDVPLARQFARRVIGMRAGAIVYDGDAAGLTEDTLARVYGARRRGGLVTTATGAWRPPSMWPRPWIGPVVWLALAVFLAWNVVSLEVNPERVARGLARLSTVRRAGVPAGLQPRAASCSTGIAGVARDGHAVHAVRRAARHPGGRAGRAQRGAGRRVRGRPGRHHAGPDLPRAHRGDPAREGGGIRAAGRRAHAHAELGRLLRQAAGRADRDDRPRPDRGGARHRRRPRRHPALRGRCPRCCRGSSG